MIDTLRFAASLIPLLVIPVMMGHALSDFKESWITSWWIGTLTVGLFLLIGHALNMPLPILFFLIGLGILWALSKIVMRSRHGLMKTTAEIPPPYATEFLVVFLFLSVSYITILSHPLNPFYSDTLVIWFNKAKGLFYGIPFVVLPFPNFAMANYPHLGPIYEMFVMKFAGAPLEPVSRLIFPTFYFFWILSFAHMLPVRTIRGLVWIIPISTVTFFDKTAYTNGYQDGLVNALAGMAAFHFTQFLNFPPAQAFAAKNHLWLATFFTGSLCFIKVEGTVIAFMLMMLFCLVLVASTFRSHPGPGLRLLSPFLTFFAIMAACWPGLLAFNHLNVAKISGSAFTYHDIFFFYQNFNRWPVISQYFMTYFQFRWPVILAAIILSAAGAWFHEHSRKALAFLWLLWPAHLLFISIVFMSTRAPLIWHLDTAFSRLIFQESFIFVTVIIEMSALLMAGMIKVGHNIPSDKVAAGQRAS